MNAKLGGKIREVDEEKNPDGILYVNLCHTDKIIPPLKDDNELADPKNDSTWKLIPYSFSKQIELPSKSLKKIAVDMHVSTAVYDLFMAKIPYYSFEILVQGLLLQTIY